MKRNQAYEDYISFAKQILKSGTNTSKEGFDTNSHEIVKLENRSKLCLIVTDLILIKHLYVSESITDMLGYEPSIIDPGFFLTILHPDDFNRFRIAHNRLLEGAQQMLIDGSDDIITSSEFRFKRSTGEYLPVLFQCYLFVDPSKFETVGMVALLTDLTLFSRKRKCIHHYFGKDKMMFRTPDLNLLNTECILSCRELEVVHLISEGYTSAQIAEKLFLSSKTVNTHRANVLKKLKATNLMESIKMLKQMGLI